MSYDEISDYVYKHRISSYSTIKRLFNELYLIDKKEGDRERAHEIADALLILALRTVKADFSISFEIVEFIIEQYNSIGKWYA